jgi:hypothetical protein
MSIIDDLNFALPGLQEMAAPVSDALDPIIVLPVHVQGDSWGDVQIGPCIINGLPPAYAAESAVIKFYHFSDTTRTQFLAADAVVIDAVDWVFDVPEIDPETFNLTPGLWLWVLWETSNDMPVTAAIGQLTVRHAV